MFSILSPQQWLGVAVLVLYAVIRAWPAISGAATSLRARVASMNQPTIGGNTFSPAADDETRAIESAKFLLKWFPPGTPGRTAAKNCWTCLFDKETPGG